MASFCVFVQDENVSVEKLMYALDGVTRQPTIYVDKNITHEDIEKSKDVSHILLAIRSHCTFFNFRLLENLIATTKYSDGEHLMEQYKMDFCEYAQALVPEIPHGIGVDKCFYIKLDESFKSCRAMYIDILKADLCKILNKRIVFV